MLGTVQAPSVYLLIRLYLEALESGDSHSCFQLGKLRHGGVVEPRFKSSRWLGTPSLSALGLIPACSKRSVRSLD